MKNIKRFWGYVFTYVTLEDYKQKFSKGRVWKFRIRNGFRRFVMLVIGVIVASIPAYIYHEVSPKITEAAPIVKEVPAEQKLSDYPILVRICNAESTGKQFLPNGNVVRGKYNRSDIGICQINEAINNDQARKLGFDIFTEKGNVRMAIWMFVNQGTQPWASSMCIPNGWGTASQCAK